MGKKKRKTLSERVAALEKVFDPDTWVDRFVDAFTSVFATKTELAAERHRPLVPIFRCPACGASGVVGLLRQGGLEVEFRGRWRFCPECGAEWKAGKLG